MHEMKFQFHEFLQRISFYLVDVAVCVHLLNARDRFIHWQRSLFERFSCRRQINVYTRTYTFAPNIPIKLKRKHTTTILHV